MKNDKNLLQYFLVYLLQYFHKFANVFLINWPLKNIFNVPEVCSGMLRMVCFILVHYASCPPPPSGEKSRGSAPVFTIDNLIIWRLPQSADQQKQCSGCDLWDSS